MGAVLASFRDNLGFSGTASYGTAEHVATLFCFIFVNDYVVLDNLIKI